MEGRTALGGRQGDFIQPDGNLRLGSRRRVATCFTAGRLFTP